MVKKSLLVLVLIILFAGSVFAFEFPFDMSAGGGAVLGYNWGGGGDDYYFDYTSKFPAIVTGIYGFFDATYIEASVSLLFIFSDIIFPYIADEDRKQNTISLGFSLLGKYPFDLGFITIYPTAGIKYEICLFGKEDGIKVISKEHNAFWFLIGGGVDYSLNERMYLRGTALYGLRLSNKLEKRWYGSDANLGHGISIRVAIGFNL
ncbi:MAG: hypothetical protein FWD47_11895 [Treponema sp.]|nr:hypothetical protein [Treponema sp.]